MANLRVDQHLVELGLAPSRTKAKELVREGAVEVMVKGCWRVVTAASLIVERETDLRVTHSDLLKYVSRSGLKLEGALDEFLLSVIGLDCLDIGQSTGGFTDCLLQRGANFVFGIDVGKGQLHPKLRQSDKVEFLEECHVKDVSRSPKLQGLATSFDLLVCDLSFISIKKALEPTLFLLKPKSSLLLLVKPQFELGKQALNKQGIVKLDGVEERLKNEFSTWIQSLGFEAKGFTKSNVKGHDGNQEYLLYAARG